MGMSSILSIALVFFLTDKFTGPARCEEISLPDTGDEGKDCR